MLTKTIQLCTDCAPAACEDSLLDVCVARIAAALLPAVLGGGFPAGSAAEEPVAMSVKPVLCITDRREDVCSLSISISWRSETEGEFCLFSDLADGPIRCWRSAASGSVTEERVIEETFTYWLANGDSADRVAEATLEVMTTDSDDRRRNRRRRHVWNIL